MAKHSIQKPCGDDNVFGLTTLSLLIFNWRWADFYIIHWFLLSFLIIGLLHAYTVSCSLLVGVRDFEGDPETFMDPPKKKEATNTLGKTRPLSASYQPPDISLLSGFAPMETGAAEQVDECQQPWYRSFHGGLLSSPPTAAGKPGDRSSFTSTVSVITDDGKSDLVSFKTTAATTTGVPLGGTEIVDPDQVWSIYYIGIIDILQRYDFSKKMEHFFKANMRCMDAHGISAVNVQDYASRFLNAMDKYFV